MKNKFIFLLLLGVLLTSCGAPKNQRINREGEDAFLRATTATNVIVHADYVGEESSSCVYGFDDGAYVMYDLTYNTDIVFYCTRNLESGYIHQFNSKDLLCYKYEDRIGSFTFFDFQLPIPVLKNDFLPTFNKKSVDETNNTVTYTCDEYVGYIDTNKLSWYTFSNSDITNDNVPYVIKDINVVVYEDQFTEHIQISMNIPHSMSWGENSDLVVSTERLLACYTFTTFGGVALDESSIAQIHSRTTLAN